MRKSVLLLSVALLLLQCSRTTELNGVDDEIWRNDPNGCKGERLAMIDKLRENKSALKESGSTDIDKLLGPPDSKDLDKRNRLYYQYDLNGSAKCDSDSIRIYLQIRFNAINRADEIILFE